jgi:spermidine synthase
LLLWLGAGLAWGQRERVLVRRRSPFNELRVIQEGHERILKVRQGKVFVEESRCDMRRPAHLLHQYSRLQMLATLYPAHLSRALVVGLGGASLTKALVAQFPDLQVESIDLDPEIVQLARHYFGYQESPRCRSLVGDGRAYLEKNPQKYDLIVLDAFDGLEIPQPLRTLEFYQLVKAHLTEGGVAVSNLHRRSGNYDRDRAGLAAVFAHTVGFQGTGLVEVISSNQPLQIQSQRWNPNWGFEVEPLLQLQQSVPDYQLDAQPFED